MRPKTIPEKELKDILEDLEKADSISPQAYESIIANFDVYPFDDYQKMYYTIGYNGEYDEMLEKIYDLTPLINPESLKELTNEGGDVCWYATRVTNAFGFSLKDVMPDPAEISTTDFNQLMKKVHRSKAKLSESIKKFFRDGKGEMTSKWKARIFECLKDFFLQLQSLGYIYRIKLTDMMRLNVLKLGKRKLEKKLHGDGDKR
ncbi:hypothetical protein LCGC14_1755030 [marine sediment metagenome]|uniref:NTP pyrophosphohydrolase MazG putative catalytic core domain-containing protein n=1 Tax=marine sediment metagenome TaxID=412755 RepID=A0A0F9K2D1_9ZZZZ|nr:hypothetical protein [bacterium]